ncbi:hypothetical protein [Croceicoccus estronivorus]|uniref:hypothetical protein n=1 Tax=Croceicoccus estronivorus TaxID=1172626 RepID=UPI0012E80A8C|nr:hypothetical protein [Croceicoccus estronivorus]
MTDWTAAPLMFCGLRKQVFEDECGGWDSQAFSLKFSRNRFPTSMKNALKTGMERPLFTRSGVAALPLAEGRNCYRQNPVNFVTFASWCSGPDGIEGIRHPGSGQLEIVSFLSAFDPYLPTRTRAPSKQRLE